MKLRSTNTTPNLDEQCELQLSLRNMGFYEEGMTLEEMRAVMEAIENSVIQRENYIDPDVERALRESELDFRHMPHGSMHNSTMINAPNAEEVENVVCCADFVDRPQQRHRSPSSSPDLGPKIMTVHALVHHPLDWSPRRVNTVAENGDHRLLRKRLFSTEHISRANDDSQATDSKRSYTNEFSSSSASLSPRNQSTDSGFNWSESSSSANVRNLVEASAAACNEAGAHLEVSSSSVAVSDYRDTTDEEGLAYHYDLSHQSHTSM